MDCRQGDQPPEPPHTTVREVPAATADQVAQEINASDRILRFLAWVVRPIRRKLAGAAKKLKQIGAPAGYDNNRVPPGRCSAWIGASLPTSTSIMKANSLNSLTAGTVAVALLALTAATLRGEVEDKINKSFQVQSGGQLVVERGSRLHRSQNRRPRCGGHRNHPQGRRQPRQRPRKSSRTMSSRSPRTAIRSASVPNTMAEDARAGSAKGDDLHVHYLITVPRHSRRGPQDLRAAASRWRN